MLIKVLMENTSISDDFATEHGLCLYIEVGGQKLLFDTGSSNKFKMCIRDRYKQNPPLMHY